MLVRSGDEARPVPQQIPTGAAVAGDRLAVTLSARDVSVVTQVYEPGATSGWHSHPGIHAVAVLEGTLTVYDSQCRSESYGPGRPYVGGQQPHLVRNETRPPSRWSSPTSTRPHRRRRRRTCPHQPAARSPEQRGSTAAGAGGDVLPPPDEAQRERYRQ